MTQLIVGPSQSRCGACGKNADPYESAHDMDRMLGDGCGATFTEVTTNYLDANLEEATKALRPDLPFVSLLEGWGKS